MSPGETFVQYMYTQYILEYMYMYKHVHTCNTLYTCTHSTLYSTVIVYVHVVYAEVCVNTYTSAIWNKNKLVAKQKGM